MKDNTPTMSLQDFNLELVISKLPAPSQLGTMDIKTKMLHIYKENKYTLNFDEFETNGKEYIPSPKDKLYFLPGCDVPRYKVRDWAAKNDVSVTIKADKATVIFAGADTIHNCIKNSTMMKMDKSMFIQWLSVNYPADNTEVVNLKDTVTNSAREFVYLYMDALGANRGSFYSTKHWNGEINEYSIKLGFKKGKGLKEIDSNFDSYCYCNTVSDNNWEILKLLDTKPDVYPQESIISVMSKDATTIDEEMYTNLCNMFNSKDKSDNLVALEVMSNCNVAPSLHYILLLLQQHAGKIYHMKESKHVNFKSLLEYIGLDRNSMNRISDDDMIECLMKKDQLTMQTVKELAIGVKQVWKTNFDSQHFKISKITISDEVKNYFKKKQEQEQE